MLIALTAEASPGSVEWPGGPRQHPKAFCQAPALVAAAHFSAWGLCWSCPGPAGGGVCSRLMPGPAEHLGESQLQAVAC